MEAISEIVRIIDSHSLINAESYQCTYEVGIPGGLTPGYYAVVWNTRGGTVDYNASARFLGPCSSRAQAADAVQEAIRLIRDHSDANRAV